MLLLKLRTNRVKKVRHIYRLEDPTRNVPVLYADSSPTQPTLSLIN